MTDSDQKPASTLPLCCPLNGVRDGAKQKDSFPPSPRHRVILCLSYAVVCHSLFAISVMAMIGMMYFGMSQSFGTVPTPYGYLINIILLAQFALGHSFLLSTQGRAIISKLAPYGWGQDMATTTFASISGLQLLLLFTLWTPTGIVWWQATDGALWVITALYAASWLLLVKASFDAGVEVQSGLLGWGSAILGRKPVYPDMPTRGLFRFTRQPIYLSFALTLWTVPTLTPDQLILATVLSSYCYFGPMLKERRFARTFGSRFEAYRESVPYWWPRLPAKDHTQV